MDKIVRQRKALMGVLVGLAITLHGLSSDLLVWTDSEKDIAAKLIRFVLSGGVIYSLMVVGPLWLYDHLLWSFANPTFNVSGTWLVELEELRTINTAHITKAGIDATKKYRDFLTGSTGQALIRQTPFRVWVQGCC
ncbi:MAG: hypothetical protein IPL77_07185 [Flavobacteriales bacterium]|nr:hypothetical protein [Flavobacteriales bacterium]